MRSVHLSKYIRIGGIILLIGLAIWYAHFQARSLLAGPQIFLDTPVQTVQGNQIIPVRGHAENITKITLNGTTIHTDESGYFNTLLTLPAGYTIMTIHAEDRYGRETSFSQSLVYNPT
ncbi:hypothetical protein COU16_00385 [Candidatus Kaiserbacteria bacterium CG10_big_fil_rev_8_21_14_0_10_47_16]|uniref:Bacterial Ig domain-containing protein n=1 Tax=Candidatus Kaiserbacteria bacterium CG10_big_fil_rev_8_21_14_0_10_47_16 TaxID=1974608 RepID=A0A2H0UEK4_9BACT|nr:MAG: hypothetical protein COU16_00385 [Candidatus Kaiserbacteria bacterium CG10_big_fil_rev_8_21_14_0_10_47_16]